MSLHYKTSEIFKSSSENTSVWGLLRHILTSLSLTAPCLGQPVQAMRSRAANRQTLREQLYYYHDHYHRHHIYVMCLVERTNSKMAGCLGEGILNNVKTSIRIMIIKF